MLPSGLNMYKLCARDLDPAHLLGGQILKKRFVLLPAKGARAPIDI